jgi:uncharacterized protein
MSLEAAIQIGRRINEHALSHNLDSLDVVLHGGEPLLVGLPFLRDWCEAVCTTACSTKINFGIQTNGTLFDEDVLRFCLEREIQVGLSMDGPQAANDRHRLDLRGNSSFEAVQRALGVLTSEEGRRVWSGFLTVIDLANDPLDVYSFLTSFRPKSIEFLLPLGHYDLRPAGKLCFEATPYADWLLQIFRVWYSEKPQTVLVRRFADIIALMAGAVHSSEEWGTAPVDFLVIESDGQIEAVDTLKVAYAGANHLNLNVFSNSFDDALREPRIIERQNRLLSLNRTCMSCSLVKVCGGGYYPHRYSTDNGFQNPSIYCADLQKLIRTVYVTVQDTLTSLRSCSSD